MNILTTLFIVSLVLAAGLTSAVLWSRHRTVVKVTALVATLSFLPVGYAAYADLLSRPKPVSLEWWQRHAEEATVVGQQMREGEALYLWLQFSGEDEPRAYQLPWNTAMAEQLQKAWEEATKNGTGVRMKLPFEPSLDQLDPKFYAMPQPALPPKDMQANEAMRVQPPGQDT